MTNFTSPGLTACKQGLQRRIGTKAVALLASVSFLAGCSGFVSDAPTESVAGALLKGNVIGGQNPVNGATVQLYTAASNGYGAAASPLGAAVMTNSGGVFTLGAYTCPASPNDQAYIVASGGNPGSGSNANLALMAALGPCGNLSGSTFITINEVTTVASAYALSGFMADYAHVGASSTNYVGLQNAMATVNNLVNIATGTALTVTPAYATPATGTTSQTFASVVPQSEINALADVIASCVNTNGVGGSSTNCANLFSSSGTNTTTGGVSGTPDTIQAALSIAQNPGSNVANLYNLATGNPPFPTTLSSPPNDWTVALNFKGGGLGGSSGTNDSGSNDVAIDGSGNLWITNGRRNTLTELNNLGAPISNNTQLTPSVVIGGFSGGGLSTDAAIAVDLGSPAHIWIGNNTGTLSEFTSAGSPVGSGFTGGGLVGPGKGVAVDGNNNIWITSPAAVAEFNNSGTPISGSGYSSDVSSPTGAISIDGGEGVIFASGGNEFVDKFNQSGTLVNSPGATLSDATAYSAIDASGQYWIPNNSISVYVYANVPAGIVSTFTQNSISNPTWVGIDGANNTWIVNNGGELGQAANANLTEMTNSGSSISPGATGYTGAGLAVLSTPTGGGIDQSGNVWIVNGVLSSSVTEFVGVAAPSYAPLAAAVAANRIGQRP
jgi:hypothetical protein